jgi:hypothetical protein
LLGALSFAQPPLLRPVRHSQTACVEACAPGAAGSRPVLPWPQLAHLALRRRLFVVDRRQVITSSSRHLISSNLIVHAQPAGGRYVAYQPARGVEVPPELECAICLGLLERPAELACSHFFCARCTLDLARVDARCPLCRREGAVTGMKRRWSLEVLLSHYAAVAEPVAAAGPVVNNLPAWSDPAVLQIDMAQLELRQETSPSQK